MQGLFENQRKFTVKPKYWFISVIIKISLFIIIEVAIISLGVWLEWLSVEMSTISPNMEAFYFTFPVIVIFYYVAQYVSGKTSGTHTLSTMLIRDNSILVSDNKRRKFRALAILQIQNIPETIKVKEERPHKKTIEKLMIPGPMQYLHTHLTYLGKFLPNLIFEFRVEENDVKLRILITLTGKNGNNLLREIKIIKNLIKTVFTQTYPGLKFETLLKKQLRNAFWDVFGDFSDSKRHSVKFGKDMAVVNHNTKEIYSSILKIANLPTFQVRNGESQIDQFMRQCLGSRFDLSFIVSSEPIEIANFKTNAMANNKNASYHNQEINIREELRTIRQSEITGVWNVSGYVIVRSPSEEQLKGDIEKIKTIFNNIYETQFSISTKRQLKGEISRISFRLPLDNHFSASSENLAILLHLPEKPVPSLDRTDVPEFSIPSETTVANGIRMGKVLLGNQELYPIHLNLNDLRLNLHVIGEKGTGKSRLVMNILKGLSEMNDEIKWTCFDWDGEYTCLDNMLRDGIVEYAPGSDLAPAAINLFDPRNSRPSEHARKLFFMLSDIFPDIFGTEMEDIMTEIFKRTVKNVKSRSIRGVINEIRTYVKENPPKIELRDETIKKIEQFFLRLKELGSIFNGEECLDFNKLIRGNAVINLKPLLMEGKENEARLFTNACLKNIIDDLSKGEPSRELNYLIVIENSHLIAQSLFREVPENVLDDVPLMLRIAGVGFIMVSPHPEILPDNSTSIAVFKTKHPYKIARRLSLNEAQEQYIQKMRGREAVVVLPNFPAPFRIFTDYINCKRDITAKNLSRDEIVNATKPTLPSTINSQRDTSQELARNLKDVEIEMRDIRVVKPISFIRLFTILKSGPVDKINLSEKMNIDINELDSYLQVYIDQDLLVKSLNDGKEIYQLSRKWMDEI